MVKFAVVVRFLFLLLTISHHVDSFIEWSTQSLDRRRHKGCSDAIIQPRLHSISSSPNVKVGLFALTDSSHSPPSSLSKSGPNVGSSSSSSSRTNEYDDRGKDWFLSLTSHIGACVLLAVALCRYEDYDCANLKPNVSSLRPMAIYGMGQGRTDRVLDWREGNILLSEDDESLVNVPSYNEVMKQHRQERVPSWQRYEQQLQLARLVPPQQQQLSHEMMDDGTIQAAVGDIYNAMDALRQLEKLASDYDWDGMRALIHAPVLQDKLDQACAVLQGASSVLSEEARDEIGFHWGSCAWRHCGARADAQEALAELYNLSGVLEPFECDFIVDIAERSLRSILAVLPKDYLRNNQPAWQGYEPHEQQREESLVSVLTQGESGGKGVCVCVCWSF